MEAHLSIELSLSFVSLNLKVKPLMDSLECARKAKADADASLKISNDLVAAVEAKLQQLQDRFMEVRTHFCSHAGPVARMSCTLQVGS